LMMLMMLMMWDLALAAAVVVLDHLSVASTLVCVMGCFNKFLK